VGSIAPTPLATDQVKFGWLDRGVPNWSYPTAPNARLTSSSSPAVEGATRIAVSACPTVTPTELLVVRPSASAIVTWNV
jgi:hypothetical protein